MITRIVCVVLALSLAMPAAVRAETPQSLCGEAAALYARGRFREAAELYEKAIAAGMTTADAYYNLGNAYYKSGDVAHSVLNFERARRLNPGDDDIAQNLLVSRARMQDRVESIPLLFAVQWWNDLKDRHRPSELLGASVVLAWICAVAVFIFFGFSDVVVRRVVLIAGSVLLAVWIASVALYVDAREDFDARRYAIVMQNEVPVASTPDASAVESFAIHAGLKVQILSQRANRCHISLADGKQGWVEMSAIERI